MNIDRRKILVGLSALMGRPPVAWAREFGPWEMASQTMAGARVAPVLLSHAKEALEAEVGQETVARLLSAALTRDADSIVRPFEDDTLEAAARRFVEIVYTGQLGPDDMTGFQQSLAWQVLDFAKPPGVCGPGFGWWSQPPAQN